MIISCEQCRAQFRLDDSKIPEGGARVRCSKCNHAFFIAPPGQADDLEAESLAREALESRRPAEPDDSESDWQFNDAASGPSDPPRGLKAARDAVDDLLGDLARAAAPGPAASRSAEPEPEAESELEAEAALETEPALGSDTELFERPEPPPAATAAPAAGSDPVGPEAWNFFEDSDEADPEAGTGPAETLGRLALMPRWKLLEQEREAAERAIEARAAAADPDELSPALRRWLGRLAGAVGWAATLGLLAVGGWRVVAGLGPAPEVAPTALELAGLRAEDLEVRWVENARSGPLLVVSGRLHPTGPGVRTGQAALELRLLDAAGEPLASASTPLGPPFPERALRESDPVELRASQSRVAAQFARLHSGESVPFQALFAEVPRSAAGLALGTGPAAR